MLAMLPLLLVGACTAAAPPLFNRSVLRVDLASANTSLLAEFIGTGVLWGHRSPSAADLRPRIQQQPKKRKRRTIS